MTVSNERLDEFLRGAEQAKKADIGHWKYNDAVMTFDVMVSILTELKSSRASPSGVEVSVVPLEWQDDEATTPFGKYKIERTEDGFALNFEYAELVHIGFNAVGPFDDIRGELRDRAEADYRTLILSCLTSPVPNGVTVSEEFVSRLRVQLMRHREVEVDASGLRAALLAALEGGSQT